MRGGAGHGFSTAVRVRPAFFDRGAHPAEKRPLYRHDAAESRTSHLTSATTVAACRAARNALPALPERLTSIARSMHPKELGCPAAHQRREGASNKSAWNACTRFVPEALERVLRERRAIAAPWVPTGAGFSVSEVVIIGIGNICVTIGRFNLFLRCMGSTPASWRNTMPGLGWVRSVHPVLLATADGQPALGTCHNQGVTGAGVAPPSAGSPPMHERSCQSMWSGILSPAERRRSILSSKPCECSPSASIQ
jgi:hypothetical protein